MPNLTPNPSAPGLPRVRSIAFVCTHNRARSQIAAAIARATFGPEVAVYSAGTAPADAVHPGALTVLAAHDLAPLNAPQSVDTLPAVDLAITLCSDSLRADDTCPVGVTAAQHLHWGLADPSAGPHDTPDAHAAAFARTYAQLAGRIAVLHALQDLPAGPTPVEFHASIRVPDLPAAARFYAWLIGQQPRAWTHRYVTFVSERLRTNFVLLVDDGKTLHQDTLYHLGIDVQSKASVIAAHHQAEAAGWHVEKPARTTWRGTPLHELWLKDPGGNLVEVYARLTAAELAEMPADQNPTFLV